MFSAQARTSIPLVKTDVNRTIKTLQEKQPSGVGVEVNKGQGVKGWGWGWGANQKKILTEVAVLCSVQKNWLMNKNQTVISD